MAPPHAENHAGLAPKPSALSVNKSNAGHKGGGGPPQGRGRDLQSAMQHAPTIRVIHIFAPKVIKTDVANFRSTVQKLTGRGKTKSQRRRDAVPVPVPVAVPVALTSDELVVVSNDPSPEMELHLPTTGAASAHDGDRGGQAQAAIHFWDQADDQEKEVLTLQRMVGDACGVSSDLVRCDSDVDSATYSLDSGNTFSGDSHNNNNCNSSGFPDHTSPTDSFSFYPQRETPYSLSEIPAPFFGGHHADVHGHFGHAHPLSTPSSQSFSGTSTFGVPGNMLMMGLPTSHSSMPDSIDPSLGPHNNNNNNNYLSSLGFDIDAVGVPFSDVGCNTGGSLFDLMPRQHCRLSVQSPYRGANFFEHI